MLREDILFLNQFLNVMSLTPCRAVTVFKERPEQTSFTVIQTNLSLEKRYQEINQMQKR